MIKKIFLAVIILSLTIHAQDDKKNPSLELPDFVITGTDLISIQKVEKIAPELVPAISEEFIKPPFSPEQLEVRAFSNPLKEEFKLLDTIHFYKGFLKGGAGIYNLPIAEFRLAQPFSSGIFQAYAEGLNQRDFVDNSSRYQFTGGLNLNLFINNESSFLPGTQFKFTGKYGSEAYKFYAVPNPSTRTVNIGRGGLDITNLLNDKVIYGARINDNFTSFKDETFSENNLNLDGFVRITLPNFDIAVNADYKKQFLTNNILNNADFNYYSLRPSLSLKVSNAFKAEFGVNYSGSENNTFISPTGALAVKLDKSLSLFAEYNPGAEFLTSSHFLSINPYFNVQSFVNLFMEKESDLNITIKYEYQKYFEVNGGVNYRVSGNYPYFKSSALPGRFDIDTTDARTFSGFLNLLFHLGPYGYLYSTASFSNTIDTARNVLPYHPAVKGYLSYGYNFSKIKLESEIIVSFASEAYTDILNTGKIPSYIDLGLKLAYQLKPSFLVTLDVSNILGNKNYNWAGYEEIPSNITGGFIYRW